MHIGWHVHTGVRVQKLEQVLVLNTLGMVRRLMVEIHAYFCRRFTVERSDQQRRFQSLPALFPGNDKIFAQLYLRARHQQ